MQSRKDLPLRRAHDSSVSAWQPRWGGVQHGCILVSFLLLFSHTPRASHLTSRLSGHGRDLRAGLGREHQLGHVGRDDTGDGHAADRVSDDFNFSGCVWRGR